MFHKINSFLVYFAVVWMAVMIVLVGLYELSSRTFGVLHIFAGALVVMAFIGIAAGVAIKIIGRSNAKRRRYRETMQRIRGY